MKYLICIIFLVIIFASTNAGAAECQKCDCIFAETKRLVLLTDEELAPPKMSARLLEVSHSIITATERYLNDCTDHKRPIVKQSKALYRLSRLADLDCPYREASIQLIDVNRDGNDELVLHTILHGCEKHVSIYDSGFSAIFFFNKEKGAWKGYPIWPIELVENTSTLPEGTLDYAQYLPKVYMLRFRDSKGRSFMAIESTLNRADSLSKFLSIIRWEGQHYKKILHLELNSWCVQPDKWIITKDGKVIVPSALATDRCKKRKEVVYPLELP
jgi:hypothetical protein